MGITRAGCGGLDRRSPALVRVIPSRAGLEPLQRLRGEAPHPDPSGGSCCAGPGGDFSWRNAENAPDPDAELAKGYGSPSRLCSPGRGSCRRGSRARGLRGLVGQPRGAPKQMALPPRASPRPPKPSASWKRILGPDRAAAAARGHGPANRAAQVHLVRLHRPGRGEERQGLQIPAEGEALGGFGRPRRGAGLRGGRGCFASPPGLPRRGC